MSEGKRSFTVEILGDAKKLIQSAKESDGALGTLANHIKGIAVTVASAFALHEVSKFASESIDAFKEVGGEVKTLTRLTGGSAEDMSRLRFAAEETGVSFESLSKGVRIASKAIETGKDKFKDLGVATHDAHGKLRPMQSILEDTAEKFSKMPDGIQKTGLAMQLFGKSGADLIPMLNRGKDGLKEFAAESDKFGLTLTGANLDALKKSTEAHRKMHAAMEGLKVQIGAQLMPLIATMTGWFAERLPGAMQKVNAFIKSVLAPAIYTLIMIFGKLTTGFENVMNGTGKASGFFEQVGAAAAKLVKHLQEFFNFLANNHTALVAFSVVLGVVAVAILAISSPITAIILGIAALALAVEYLVSNWSEIWEKIKSAASDALNALPGILADGAKALWQWIVDASPVVLAKLGEWATALGNWLIDTALPQLGTWLLQLGAAFIQWIADSTPGLLTNLANWLVSFQVWVISTALPKLVGLGLELAAKLIVWVIESTPKLLANLAIWLGDLAVWFVTTALPKLAEKGTELGGKLIGMLVDAVTSHGADVLSWFAELPGKIGKALIDGLVSLLKSVKDFVGQILDELNPLNHLGGTGGLNPFSGDSSGGFQNVGHKAAGGSVLAGTMFRGGELGLEVFRGDSGRNYFVAPENGTVIPHSQIGLGGGVNIAPGAVVVHATSDNESMVRRVVQDAFDQFVARLQAHKTGSG